MSFAKATVSGTLVTDPEKRFTNNNLPVATFTLSVENPSQGRQGGSNEPFQVRVTCWRGLADSAAEQLRKGDDVVVEGKLIFNSYQSQEGVQKKNFEIEASTLHKVPGRLEPIVAASGNYNSASGGAAAPSGGGAPVPAAVSSGRSGGTSDGFSAEDLLTDDDIPF